MYRSSDGSLDEYGLAASESDECLNQTVDGAVAGVLSL
jgi:hypothetical protein